MIRQVIFPELGRRELDVETLRCRANGFFLVKPHLIKEYLQCVTPAPPIEVDRNGEIIDGRHRLFVAILRGCRTIDAVVVEEKY